MLVLAHWFASPWHKSVTYSQLWLFELVCFLLKVSILFRFFIFNDVTLFRLLHCLQRVAIFCSHAHSLKVNATTVLLTCSILFAHPPHPMAYPLYQFAPVKTIVNGVNVTFTLDSCEAICLAVLLVFSFHSSVNPASSGSSIQGHASSSSWHMVWLLVKPNVRHVAICLSVVNPMITTELQRTSKAESAGLMFIINDCHKTRHAFTLFAKKFSPCLLFLLLNLHVCLLLTCSH